MISNITVRINRFELNRSTNQETLIDTEIYSMLTPSSLLLTGDYVDPIETDFKRSHYCLRVLLPFPLFYASNTILHTVKDRISGGKRLVTVILKTGNKYCITYDFQVSINHIRLDIKTITLIN